MLSRKTIAAILMTSTAAGAAAARAQQVGAPIRLAVGFGVDTVRSPMREILALYRSYLEHRTDSVALNPYWSRSEQQRWRVFDLLSGFIYQGFPHFTVVHLAPAVGLDSTYLIRTLIFAVDDSTREVRPLALYRVYATREAGRWVLANALLRLTRTWRRDTIGRVTFIYPPSHRFVRRRAESSAAFVDSLAHAFQVPAPAPIGYYFTGDLSETFAAMGLDYFPIGADTAGGRANVWDHLVFIGSSSIGEGYRHELAHVVLAPLFVGAKTPGLVVEGLMTWTGGSAGLDFSDLVPGLGRYLEAHRDLTLEGLLNNPPPRDGTLDVGYDGIAVLCAMVHAKGGLEAVREFVTAGPGPAEVLDTAARLLGVPRDGLDALWRSHVLHGLSPSGH